jgi:hypothetical protein
LAQITLKQLKRLRNGFEASRPHDDDYEAILEWLDDQIEEVEAIVSADEVIDTDLERDEDD